MSEMIDRVARAICASDFDGDTAVFDEMSEAQRGNFLINARAAIEAMMDPTEGMVNAGLVSLAESTGWPSAHIARDPLFVWRAMLRSSLNQEGGEG